MEFIKRNWRGILVCLVIAIPSWILGKLFPIAGGAVIAIIAGMVITMFWNDKGKAEAGIKWTSKLILQETVITNYHMYNYNLACYCMDTSKIA